MQLRFACGLHKYDPAENRKVCAGGIVYPTAMLCPGVLVMLLLWQWYMYRPKKTSRRETPRTGAAARAKPLFEADWARCSVRARITRSSSIRAPQSRPPPAWDRSAVRGGTAGTCPSFGRAGPDDGGGIFPAGSISMRTAGQLRRGSVKASPCSFDPCGAGSARL